MLTFLRAMPNVKNPTNPLAIDKSEDLTIVVEEIHFSYPVYDEHSYLTKNHPENENQKALTNLSFTVNPKSIIAITGPSNSGKSALAKLLVRLYDVDEGIIRFGDVNVKDANIYEIQEAIALISRNPYIIEGSIAENINYGSVDSIRRPEVLQRVKQVATQALLGPLLQTLPRGIHTILTEDAPELTLGQRQLINIARALRKDTPVVGRFSFFISIFNCHENCKLSLL